MGFTRSMDYLHPILGIRCVGLATGAFQTPLWVHENASSMDNDDSVPLSEVVDAFFRCIKDEVIQGGEILEVLTGKTRILPLGGPRPSGACAGPAVEGFENACKKVINLFNEQKIIVVSHQKHFKFVFSEYNYAHIPPSMSLHALFLPSHRSWAHRSSWSFQDRHDSVCRLLHSLRLLKRPIDVHLILPTMRKTT